jgi:hypothetical protein
MGVFDGNTCAMLNAITDQPYGKYFHGKVVDMFYFPFGTQLYQVGCRFGVEMILRFLMPFLMLPIWPFRQTLEY